MAILGGIALVAFGSVYLFDHGPSGALSRYIHFEPGLISDAVAGLAAMTAAVLGIVITVVSLLVQLTSGRYTGVAQMFLRDRTNVFVMAYYVVTCVVGVALSLSLHTEFVPRAAVLTMMFACALGLVIMLPYFAYVFRFLEPVNLVARIEAEAAADVTAAATAREQNTIRDAQRPAVVALEELTDITTNSIAGKDKIIASRAVDAIKDFIVAYLAVKNRADERW